MYVNVHKKLVKISRFLSGITNASKMGYVAVRSVNVCTPTSEIL